MYMCEQDKFKSTQQESILVDTCCFHLSSELNSETCKYFERNGLDSDRGFSSCGYQVIVSGQWFILFTLQWHICTYASEHTDTIYRMTLLFMCHRAQVIK